MEQETLEKDKLFIKQVLDNIHVEFTNAERDVIFDLVYRGFKPLKTEEKTQEKLLKLIESAIVFSKRISYGDACHYSAAVGHIDLVEYAHQKGCVWNETTMREATAHGHLDCLKYLHEHGCPWDRSLFDEPQFLKGLEVHPKERLKCLAYAIEHECPHPFINQVK